MSKTQQRGPIKVLRRSGALDQPMFEKVFRDNLSPLAIAAIVAYLAAASQRGPSNESQREAIDEIEWLVDTLTDLLGESECNRLREQLDL